MPAHGPVSFLKKIVSAVRRDPQKAGILTVLVAILVVLQVRLQMSGKEMTARATTSATSASSASANNIGSLSAVTSHAPAKPIDSATALRAWMDAPPVSIGRNLFAANLSHFPQDNGRIASGSSKVSGFWDELAKSMTLRADVRKERQVLVENLTQQASQLRLQSTVMGVKPKAVINGELVAEGDVVASGTGDSRYPFRVLKIEARRILVEREGIKLEIQMK